MNSNEYSMSCWSCTFYNVSILITISAHDFARELVITFKNKNQQYATLNLFVHIFYLPLREGVPSVCNRSVFTFSYKPTRTHTPPHTSQ